MTQPDPEILFLDRATLPLSVRLRAPAVPRRWTSFDATAADQVAGRIRDATVVVTNKVPIAGHAMAGAPLLRLIAVAATGTDRVDVAAARERGIAVCNVRGYANHAVPEHCFAMILALRRNLIAYRRSVLHGRWQESGSFCFFDHPVRDLAGSTLGVIGSGALGNAMARLGEAFGMSVLHAERKGAPCIRAGRVVFEQVLAASDVITVHLPLDAATRGLIGSDEFALMARRPILINAARGGIVDEVALELALAEGRIAGAGIDVAAEEPPASDSPLMRLATRPDVLLTPHVAWASVEATQALADQLIDTIDAFFAGQPRNLI